MITLKSAQEIAFMHQAGRIVAETLQELGKRISPGVTTGELNKFAEDFIREAGGVPAFLNYQGFPASICASVNNEVVHGIPGLRILENGDIISIDVGVFTDNHYFSLTLNNFAFFTDRLHRSANLHEKYLPLCPFYKDMRMKFETKVTLFITINNPSPG
jgi:hypothetical protein